MAAMRLNLEADSLMEAILSFILPPARTTGQGGGGRGALRPAIEDRVLICGGPLPDPDGTTQQTQRIDPMLFERWASVVDAGSTLKQRLANASLSLVFFQELQPLTCVSWVTGRKVDFKKGRVKFVAFAVKVSPSAFDCTHCQPSFEWIPHTDV